MNIQLDEKVIEARRNEDRLETLIGDYEPFILASASQVAKHHVSKSDDEWSIALIAFHEAIQSFDRSQGHFLGYAKRVIRSRLIDYFRTQNRHLGQTSLDQVSEHHLQASASEPGPRDEIDALSQTLQAYGFSVMDLVASSPKARKTKKACRKIIRYLLQSPALTADLQHNHRLPVQLIEKKTQVPRKIIERHRKYIVTAVEILAGDYPHLSEYLAYVRTEENQ